MCYNSKVGRCAFGPDSRMVNFDFSMKIPDFRQNSPNIFCNIKFLDFSLFSRWVGQSVNYKLQDYIESSGWLVGGLKPIVYTRDLGLKGECPSSGTF